MGARERRWAAIYAHRDRLLRIARARVDNPHDAEDCVQEAMVRCVEFADLDEERLGQFLTTVTIRLCADVHRGQTRGAKLSRRLTSFVTDDPGPEESVCDQAESAWLSRRLDGLTPKQRAIVEARAEGLSCGAVAERLLIPYTTVESALARIRRSMRGALESTLGLATVPSGLNLRRLLAGAVTATAAVATVASFVAEPAEVRPRAQAPWYLRAGNDVARGNAAAAAAAATGFVRVRATTSLTIQTPGAPTTVVAPGVVLHAAEREPFVDADVNGAQVGTHSYTDYDFQQRIDHCARYGYAVGDVRSGCRYPPGDPRNDQHETVGTPPMPEEGNT